MVATDPRSPERQDAHVVEFVNERMAVAARLDKPYKDAALRHWLALNNILPDDWPYYSRFFEPETQNAANETVEGIMGKVFEKDEYFDLVPVEDQDEEQTEMMRELMRFVLRRARYKMAKFFQCQEAVYFGNGVERHVVTPKIITRRSWQPQFSNDLVAVRLGVAPVVTREMEVWPSTKPISRFDCYPGPTGSTIQEMPYFIERIIMPLEKLKAMGRWAGFRNLDKIQPWYSVDRDNNVVRGEWTERDFELTQRMALVGLDVGEGAPEEGGEHAVEYVEVLLYTEASPGEDGCSRMVMVANGQHLLQDRPNPFHHGRKPYSEIKFQPRGAQQWQAKGVPELIETLQEKLNTRLAQAGDIIEEIKSPMTFVGSDAGVKDLTELSPWPGAIVRVNKPEAIVPRIRPGVPPDIFSDINLTRASIQRAGGSLDYSRGIAGGTTGLSRGTETASGLSQLLSAANQAKTFRWLLAEEGGIVEGLETTASLVQQVVTEPTKVRILGENRVLSQRGWQRHMIVAPEDIAGRFDFYPIGASRAMESEEQAALGEKIVAAGMQMPDVGPRLKQLDIWQELAEMIGFRNPRRFLLNDQEWAAKQAEMAQRQPQQSPEVLLELIKSLDYKDAPPDVQAQLEQLAGLQPSQFHTLQAGIQSVVDKLRAAAPKPQPAAPSRP